jgi:hypothetical protein
MQYSFPVLRKVPEDEAINQRVEWFARLARKQNNDLSLIDSYCIAQVEIQRQLDILEEVQRQLDILERNPVSIKELMPWVYDIDSMSDDSFNSFLEESCRELLRVV